MPAPSEWKWVCLGMILVGSGCAQALGLDQEPEFVVGGGGAGGMGTMTVVPCVNPTDCPGTDNVCGKRSCVDGTCAREPGPKGTPCAGDGECDGMGTCKKTLGQACASSGECASNACVDGYCCSESCSNTCAACSAAKKGQGDNGTCGPIQPNFDPDNECTNGTCNGQMGCMFDVGVTCAQKEDCASGFCVDGVCCEDACTATCMSCGIAGAMGMCVYVPIGQNDSTGMNPCLGINTCNGSGQCEKGNGQSCGVPADCVSGFCVDGVCCDKLCSGTCVACNVPGNVGTCVNTPANQDDPGSCTGAASSCDGNGNCRAAFGQPCSSDSNCATGSCNGGICTGASCNGLAVSCGPQSETCCASPLVLGGTFNRSNDSQYPATVNDFRLDRFEVTVGRFRKFVAAYPANKPAPGSGAHPLIPGSGWDSALNGSLPIDQASLTAALACSGTNQTWTSAPAGKETMPINCIDWSIAFAFCAWDGGRLPTEAEWNFAAAAGSQQREYPWSNPPNAQTIDSSYAVYSTTLLQVVGAKSPKGDAKSGQADMGGNVWEWTLDRFQSVYPNPCVNCANLANGTNRVFRGGGWDTSGFGLLTSGRYMGSSGNNSGIRCARSP